MPLTRRWPLDRRCPWRCTGGRWCYSLTVSAAPRSIVRQDWRRSGRVVAVLVSESAAEHLAGRLPAVLGLVERGVHRLFDLGRPERVWQLRAIDASVEPATLRSLSTFPNNLPTPLTPFIGRHDDIDTVVELVTAARLVTVTGAGGVGKTRLALSVAARAPQSFQGGAWNVELAPVGVGGDVGRAVLGALRVGERSGVAIEVQVSVALGDETSLLVLDNCEHLRDDCATLVGRLLGANKSVTVLATSREPLGVPGEVTWRLPSLSTPESDGVVAPGTLYEHDASRLFVERALRADPRLEMRADDSGRSSTSAIVWTAFHWRSSWRPHDADS